MNSKFHVKHPFTEVVDNERHPKFQDVTPLTPKQMLYRQAKGMPISASTPESRFTVNNRFHSADKLDVYDYLLKSKNRLESRLKNQQTSPAAQQQTSPAAQQQTSPAAQQQTSPAAQQQTLQQV